MQFAGDSSHYHPSQDYGLIALPLAFAAQYFWLWQRKDREDAGYHIVGFLTLILLAGFELGHCFNEYQHGDAQRISGWLIAAACGIALLSLPERKQVWPLTVLNGRYIQEAAIPLVVWAFCLCLYTFRLTGASPDGSYIPLLNLVDMAELAAMLSMLALCKTIPNGAGFRRVIITLSAINLFGFLNCLLLRMASAYMDVDYFSYTMWRSMGVQTMLTILWTMTAMSAMVFSSRKQIREGWLLGALLLGCVVLKLFTVDLSGIGTLSRIISFMGVGVLCLALGYLSPMPPKQREV